jgi:hypothetical protein
MAQQAQEHSHLTVLILYLAQSLRLVEVLEQDNQLASQAAQAVLSVAQEVVVRETTLLEEQAQLIRVVQVVTVAMT